MEEYFLTDVDFLLKGNYFLKVKSQWLKMIFICHSKAHFIYFFFIILFIFEWTVFKTCDMFRAHPKTLPRNNFTHLSSRNAALMALVYSRTQLSAIKQKKVLGISHLQKVASLVLRPFKTAWSRASVEDSVVCRKIV